MPKSPKFSGNAPGNKQKYRVSESVSESVSQSVSQSVKDVIGINSDFNQYSLLLYTFINIM